MEGTRGGRDGLEKVCKRGITCGGYKGRTRRVREGLKERYNLWRVQGGDKMG